MKPPVRFSKTCEVDSVGNTPSLPCEHTHTPRGADPRSRCQQTDRFIFLLEESARELELFIQTPAASRQMLGVLTPETTRTVVCDACSLREGTCGQLQGTCHIVTEPGPMTGSEARDQCLERRRSPRSPCEAKPSQSPGNTHLESKKLTHQEDLRILRYLRFLKRLRQRRGTTTSAQPLFVRFCCQGIL